MRRRLKAMLAMVVLTVMLAAAPALAAAEFPREFPNFHPNDEHAGPSCGLAAPAATEAIAIEDLPGAGEYARVSPVGDCAGQPQ